MFDKEVIGSKAAILNDTVKGVIIAVSKTEVTLLDEDGFERTYKKGEIIIYKNTELLSQGKIITKDTKQTSKRKKKKNFQNPSVIDLHNTNQYLQSSEILQNQLQIFKHHLNKSQRNKLKSITFIHGIGEGILRKNIEKILLKEGINFSDAPYYKYGYGAIEVFL